MNTRNLKQLLPNLKRWVFGSAVILLSACFNDLQTGETLPEGKYPVKITTSIKASVTRSTVDDNYFSGDKVAIQAVTKANDNMTPWDKMTTYLYKGYKNSLDPQNSNETHYWTSSNETKQIRGWYTPKLTQDSTAVPTSWTVAADQNANDGKGYEESDLLFAPPVEVKYGNEADLTFYHQTAKVIINIKKGGIISQESQIKAIKIGDDNMALSADYKAPETAKKTYGDWILKDKGSIIPHLKYTMDAFLNREQRYEALIIPQNMSGKKFISITTDKDSTYSYIPSGDDANLQPGTTYTYNITVRNNEIEVQAMKSNAWIDSGESENIQSSLKRYEASDIKLGDLLYRNKDGSWGIVDGGLRFLFEDGSYTIDENIHIPSDKNYLGIVFYVGDQPVKDSYGLLKTDDFKDGKMHGLILSLWDIDEEGNPVSDKDVRWTFGYDYPIYINITDPIRTIYLIERTTYQGYANTIALRQYNQDYERKDGSRYVIPIYAIDEFAKKENYKAPMKTSGWYFASNAEMSVCNTYRGYINNQMNRLISNSFIPFTWSEWSSSVFRNGGSPIKVGQNTSHVCLRPILAF